MAFKIPDFKYKGIKRITIPKVDADFSTEDFGWAIIKKYLPNILADHQENAKKIDFFYNYFLGDQDILDKRRQHKINEKNNHRDVENHASRQVEFKVGFLCGERRDYTFKSDSDSDDLIYLDRYFTDCNFFAKDADLKEWIYTTGIGVTHTAPRTDIILSGGVDAMTKQPKTRYATKEDGYDVEYEAPFEFDCVDPKQNFVVYSSAIDNKPLFCVSFADVDLSGDDESPKIGKQLLIETRYASFKFNSDAGFSQFYWDTKDVTIVPKFLRYLPLIEFSVNKDRIGIIERNRSSFNTINLFRSSVNDMIVDNANAILVFKNVDIESEEVQAMREAGAIIISDSQTAKAGANADLKTITVEIPFDKMTTYVDQVVQNCYDIVGVPLASGQVTSGGDTGQARLLGGGWNNAYIIIHKEIQCILGQDYEQLKLFLMLCNLVPDSKVDQLYASQIDINYRVNQNDNFLVKTQGMMNLYNMGCDLEFILKVGGLSNDIKTDSKMWRENLERNAEKAEAQTTNEEVIEYNNSQE
ncbi:MAG: phage portal protein [Clostridia bacterium]|nr:phage portal protein [Clostridia bacterium]